jgi:pimeloyl-ACP methyl ester carboxylesterase
MLSFHSIRGIGTSAALLCCLASHGGRVTLAQSTQPAAATASTFTIYVRAQTVGTERVSVERSNGGWTITSTGRLGAPLNIVTRQLEVKYDPQWRPLSLSIDATAGGREVALRTTVNGSTARNEMTTDGKPEEKTDTIDPASVLLPNPFFATYEALAARLREAAAGSSVPVYIAPNAQFAVRVGDSADEQIETAAGTFTARHTRFTLMQPGMPLDAEIWSDEAGRMVRLRIPAQNLDVVREDVGSVAARRVTVSRPNDEQVRIPGNGFLLAGTISKPIAAPQPDGATGRTNRQIRLPAVVLVAGASTADRDEVTFGIPIFGQLSDALADAGFVVLRYDKRGIGQSGGRVESATLTDYAEDLRAAVRFVSDREDVDRDRIAVVGYAEGGWVALLTAARENRVEAVVLLNTPGVTGAELSMAQVMRAMERSSQPAMERERTVTMQRMVQDAVLTGKGWETVPPAMREQADTPWFKSYLSFDPARPLRDVDQPLLIVHGTLDAEVLPANADRLAENARQRNRQVEVVKLDGINHLLAAAKTGEVDEYSSPPAHEVSPAVGQAIAAWLTKTFAGRR